MIKKIVQNKLLSTLALVAIFTADASASAATMWFFNQPKCPKELLK